ncbi:uncharacterized protein LOC143210612 [Lasioglossum baleicum]|uniref:uncharacterized protein LOC143210612 n=1 Tax=Lasioglossum baleicum TaxID=434251 RepID=UPI003FCD3704
MVPLTRLLLLSGILSGFAISIAGTPVNYDQRQTGEVNVDAKLDNFLILVSPSSNEGLWNSLLTSEVALGLLASRRSAIKQEPGSQKPTETTVYETEDKEEGKEPYHVEIVRIEKDGDTVARSKQPEILNAEVTEVKIAGKIGEATKILQETPEVSIDKITSEKGSRNQKSRKLIERSRKVRVGSTVEDLAQADDLATKEEASKAARPGISLKKQLSKKEEEELSALSEERNELGNKRDELVLLGDGVENCGPGRYRDKSGTCQEDKNFY